MKTKLPKIGEIWNAKDAPRFFVCIISERIIDEQGYQYWTAIEFGRNKHTGFKYRRVEKFYYNPDNGDSIWQRVA
jgi:hypothetical protein